MVIDGDVILKLSQLYSDKKISQKLLFESLKSFSDFSNALYIYKAKTHVLSSCAMGCDEYTATIRKAESVLQNAENAAVAAVIALNRMAERAGLGLVCGNGNAELDRKAVIQAVINFSASVLCS